MHGSQATLALFLTYRPCGCCQMDCAIVRRAGPGKLIGVISPLHSLTPGEEVLSVMAFHEKAGRSQVASWFLLDKFLLLPSRHCPHPSSALFDERFCSLGASWVFSFQPVLPPDFRPCFHLGGWKLGQAINAVTETRRWAFVFPSWNILTLCCRRHRCLVTVAQRFVHFSAHPQTMQQHR